MVWSVSGKDHEPSKDGKGFVDEDEVSIPFLLIVNDNKR